MSGVSDKEGEVDVRLCTQSSEAARACRHGFFAYKDWYCDNADQLLQCAGGRERAGTPTAGPDEIRRAGGKLDGKRG